MSGTRFEKVMTEWERPVSGSEVLFVGKVMEAWILGRRKRELGADSLAIRTTARVAML